VRKLADRTTASTKEIAAVIEAIQQDTAQAAALAAQLRQP
jgi:methyl-accepting chemotaxis protein